MDSRPAARARRPGPGQVPDRGDRGGHGIVALTRVRSRSCRRRVTPRQSSGPSRRGRPRLRLPSRPRPGRRGRPGRRRQSLGRNGAGAASTSPRSHARRRRSRPGPCSPTRAPDARRCRRAQRRYATAAAGLSQSARTRAVAGAERARRRRAAPARQWQLRRISRRRLIRPPSGPTAAPDRASTARGVQGEKGLLIEAVPRRMRVGVPTTAEVRIARDKVDGLLAALNGRDPNPSADASLARGAVGAAARRRRAASGSSRPRRRRSGSTARPAASRTTTWPGAGPWCPAVRGRGRLTLMVSAHTIRPRRHRGRVLAARSRDRRENPRQPLSAGIPVDGVDRGRR